MFSQPSLTGQPVPRTTTNNVRKAVRAILILVFVVVIVILLSLAVILSGRTGTNPLQTPSPAPTTTPTMTRLSTISLIFVSVGLLQPSNSEMQTCLKTAEREIDSANEITALPLNALQFNY